MASVPRRALSAACLVFTLVLPAAGARAAVKNPDTYIHLEIAEPDSLDPAWATDSLSQGVILSLYDTLFAYTGHESLAPRVAARVPARSNGLVSADRRRYEIPIRKGIRFHDGSPLTAEDVRYSLLRFMLQDPDGGPSAQLLAPLLGRSSTRDARGRPDPRVFEEAARAVRVEDGSIVLALPAPFEPLLDLLAVRVPIVSRDWAAAHGDWDGSAGSWMRFNNPDKQSSPFFMQANGSGPFRLERWDRGLKELILARNDAYWGEKARLARVVLRAVPEFGTRALALQAADADSIRVDVGNVNRLRGRPGVVVIDDLPRWTIEPVGYFTFAIEPAGNPHIGSGRLDGDGIPPGFFSDKDVRLGFAHAFDYAGFVRDVYHGTAVQAIGFAPRAILGYGPEGAAFSYDLEKAARHLRRAWGGKAWERGFRFTLVYNTGNASRGTLCQMLQRSIEGLNPKFRVELRALDWPAYLDAAKGRRLPLALFNLSSDYPDPHGFAHEAMHSMGGPALQGYRNPAADRLISRAAAEGDPAERRKLYLRLQRIEREDVPHLLFIEAPAPRAYGAWVRGDRRKPWSFLPSFYDLYKEEP